MRIFEVMTGAAQDAPEEYLLRAKQIIDIWPRLRKQCSEMFAAHKDAGKGWLLRGYRNKHPDMFKGQSADRYPEDGERREEADAWLSSHGFSALRGNSIFCSNTGQQTFNYGETYLIFPVNGFKYTWYRNATDLYQNNFNITLTQKDLSIDELMDVSQPSKDGLVDMLKANRNHELHFTGAYWAFNSKKYSQIIMDLANNGRYMIPLVKAALQRDGII